MAKTFGSVGRTLHLAPVNGFLEADMQEQTYPPKRPNMAHFASPEKQSAREESEAQLDRLPADGQEHSVPQQPDEKPTP
jgi:hypothetical protein